MSLICFDLDNTLVDSDRLHILAFKKAFQDYNLPKVRDAVIRSLLSITSDLLVKKIFPELPKGEIRKVVESHNKYIVAYAKGIVKQFPGVKPTLIKIKERHRLGIVSNCSRKEIVAILESAGISIGLFDVIVSDDRLKHGKPWPDGILKAGGLMQSKVDYMVGDSPYDVMAGKRAGCKTVAVLTGDFSRERLKKEKPDYIINSLKELLGVV